MKAFKCDLCGKYYDDYTTSDIEFKKDFFVKFINYHRNERTTDICESCKDIFKQYIKTAYKDICVTMEDKDEETENNNTTGDE